jgi:hypothetical protein
MKNSYSFYPLLLGALLTANANAQQMVTTKPPINDTPLPLPPTNARIQQNARIADQVIADDLIVQGSQCVGFDCVNNESFGFNTIRLKENNLRIGFDDTSVGSFPANDWELEANASPSGGTSHFAINDVTGAKTPFLIRAGAKTNALYIDASGRIGMGTSTPALDAHITTSNTPAIRFEQNNAGGFTAQTWDMAGNEANFFIRDVTGGSLLPFRIKPGAPTSSIYIQADGTIQIKNAIVPASDFRLKTNFSKIENALGIIEQLNPLRYDFRYNELKDMGLPKTRQLGLIAQDVEKILPELVTELAADTKDGEKYKGLNYTGLIPVLIQAIKDQQAMLAKQEEELEKLRNQLKTYEALNARMERLEAVLNEEKTLKTGKEKK